MRYLLVFLFLSSVTLASDPYILSLKATKLGDEKSLPVLLAGEKLKIEFDVESNSLPDLVIVFRFCDKNWKPVDNIFLQNNGYNIERNLWYDRLPTTVTGADYHCKTVFPNNNVKFPFYGKWRYFITDYEDTSIVYGEGRFFYIKERLQLSAEIKHEQLSGVSSEPSTFGQVYNVTTKFVLPDSLEEFRLQNVEIIENHKLDYPVIIKKNFTSDTRYFEWGGGMKFQYTAKDIQPGNDYRQADIRDRSKYSSPYTNAHFDGVDVSRLFNYKGHDNNGAFLLNDFKNEYSDYMNVTFELRLPENITDDVYLVGAFTGWSVYPGFKMYKDKKDLYYLTVELKRGIYDYMYVTGTEQQDNVEDINWLAIEGNSWTTGNDYYIFLYYKSEQKGEYDEIIGYKKISSGKK